MRVTGRISDPVSGSIAGRILGVDPGNVVTGFGVIEGGIAKPTHIAAGTIRPPAALRGGERLQTIHKGLLDIIDQYAPAAMSLERNFVAANVQSAFRLGEARAMAMLAAASRGLALFEYTPNQVKVTVAGHGHADKAQVKFMVRRTLGLGEEPALADDASDALAIALCHLYCARVSVAVAARAGDRSSKRGTKARVAAENPIRAEAK
jgi:crossover junction endodeoxyribonuclease RuvC